MNIVDTASRLIEEAKKAKSADFSGVKLQLDEQADVLVVSCSGVVPNRVIYSAENSSYGMKTIKLSICDKDSLWYYGGISGITETFDETISLISCIIRLLNPNIVCAFGVSGGGYMALALGALLNLDRVLAFSPQTTIRGGWRAAHGDGRWKENIEKIHNLVGAETTYEIADLINNKNKKTEFHIIYPSREQLDKMHADNLNNIPNVHSYEFDTDQHNVAQALGEAGKFRVVLDRFVANEMQELVGVVEPV